MRALKLLETLAVVAVAVLLVVGVVRVHAEGARLEARTLELTSRYNARARAALPRFLREADLVEHDPDFAFARPNEASPGEDAGRFLNPRLPWRAGGVEITPGPRALALPEPLAHKLNAWGTYWVAQADDVDVDVADDTWMLQLRARASHWSLGEGVPARDALPDFTLLQQWAKVRLLRGQHAGEVGTALSDVTFLASLCMSTETLEGELAAVGMLELEQKFLAAQRQGGGHAVNLDALRRVLWGAVAYAAPFVDPAVRQQAQQVAIGRCAALDEAARFEALRRVVTVPQPGPTPEGCHPSPTRLRHAAQPADPRDLVRIIVREPLLQGWKGKLRMRLFPEQSARLLQVVGADDTGLRLLEAPAGAPVLEQVHGLR